MIFQKLNNVVRPKMVRQWMDKLFAAKPKTANNSGQVAIVLVLVCAIAIIFYAVTLNLGDVSEVKTRTQIAATKGASSLASGMASYGQSVFKQTLGGRRKYCKGTSLIVTIIVAIIVVIVAYICGPCTAPFVAFVAALMAATVLINAMYVQPTISKMWNKIQSATLSQEDRMLEDAIQGGLADLVNDLVNVPDIDDLDTDRKFGYEIHPITGEYIPKDTIPRFAIYYGERLGQITPIDATIIENFIDPLREFIYVEYGTNNWGVFDGTGCRSYFMSECSPCCVPSQYVDPYSGEVILLRDDPSYEKRFHCSGADGTQDDVFWSNLCAQESPYRADWPWVYDPSHQNDFNNYPDPLDPTAPVYVSFLEALGRDDENQFRMSSIDGLASSPHDMIDVDQKWRALDTWGFYSTPGYPQPVPPNDHKHGIFKFLQKVAGWGMDLESLDIVANKDHCLWYDPSYEGICMPPIDAPLEITNNPLVLPVDPATLVFDTEPYVRNTTENVADSPPLASDIWDFPDPNLIMANPSDCAQTAGTLANPPKDPNMGFWKPGGDLFCSNAFPYRENCPKHAGGCEYDDEAGGTFTIDCRCGPNGDLANTDLPGDEFPEDILDDIVYGLPEFAVLAQRWIAKNPRSIMRDLESWWAEAQQWLDPSADPPGFLTIFEDEIQYTLTQLEAWRDAGFAAAGGDEENCRNAEAWCVPSDFSCIPPAELAANAGYNHDGDGTLVEVPDIINCLDYNSNNAPAFQACRENCDAVNCDESVLPRSYDPDFPRDGWSAAGDAADLALILDCYDHCTEATCRLMPQYSAGGACVEYFTQDPSIFFDASTACYDISNQYFATNPSTFDETVDSWDPGPSGFGWFSNDPATFNAATECHVNWTHYFDYDNDLVADDPALFDFEAAGCCTNGVFLPGAPGSDCDGWWQDMRWYFAEHWFGTSDPLKPADWTTLADCFVTLFGVGTCDNATCQAMPYTVPIRETSIWYIEGSAVPQGSIFPGDNANGNDINLINTCLNECGDVNCQAMPDRKNWGRDVPWFDAVWTQMFTNPLLHPDDLPLLGACLSGVNAGTDLTCQAMPQYERLWKPGNTWFDEMSVALGPPGTVSAADRPSLEACETACRTQQPYAVIDPICQAMPRVDAATCGIEYFPRDPATAFFASDCNALPEPDPLAMHTRPNDSNGWLSDIITALTLINPACDLSPGGWLDRVEDNWIEAMNQSAKFTHRRNFIQARWDELNDTIAVFEQARDEFNAFLGPGGPVEQLITDVNDELGKTEEDKDLSFQAVYAWQDPPTGNRPAPNENVGYYHAVRVDARMPGRCNDDPAINNPPVVYGNSKCGRGDNPSARWPWVHTYTKRWGTKRCFELKATDGLVKFRATRFDESRDPSVVTFPNGLKIWDFRYFHPDKGSVFVTGNLFADVGGSSTDCHDLMVEDPINLPAGLPPADRNIYKGAVLMGKPIPLGTSPEPLIIKENMDCWNAVDSYLQAGVVTDICAAYFFSDGDIKGFTHEFVPCPNNW